MPGTIDAQARTVEEDLVRRARNLKQAEATDRRLSRSRTTRSPRPTRR
jgi:hypothetical protein